MPIDYQRDDRRRLITVTLTEPVSFDDLLGQTDRQWTEDTWEYAVLYDTRATVRRFPPGELQQLLDRTEAVGGGRARGPVGVAIPSSAERYSSGLELATRGGPNRNIEILLNARQLDAWLMRHAARRGPS